MPNLKYKANHGVSCSKIMHQPGRDSINERAYIWCTRLLVNTAPPWLINEILDLDKYSFKKLYLEPKEDDEDISVLDVGGKPQKILPCSRD